MNMTLQFSEPTFKVEVDGQVLLAIWCMDVLEALDLLEDNSIHTVMVSPPYYKLRDYGWDGQIGHEKTLAEHLAVLVRVFRKLRQKLHPSGTVYLNYGDAYAQHGRPASEHELHGRIDRTIHRGYDTDAFASYRGYNRAAGTAGAEFTRKQLMMIPARLAIALQDDGWWVRGDLIWSKANPLPESVPDRPSRTHEYVYMLTKRPRYFYDQFVLRDAKPGEWGRRLRSVWTIATEPCKKMHYATFPRELVRRCILPSTSRLGCCPKCLEPVVPVYRAGELDEQWQKSCGGANYAGQATKDYKAAGAQDPSATKKRILKGLRPRHLVGGNPGCKCLARIEDAIPCLVADVFGGVGTVPKVALANGFRAVMIEGSTKYCEIAWRELEPRARLLGQLKGGR